MNRYADQSYLPKVEGLMYTRIGCAVLLVGILGGSPALAQINDRSSEERIALLMSRMPLKTSAAYGLLMRAAGSPIVKSLVLTKSEMWSVRKDSVAAVMKAAARHDVEVRQLGAPIDSARRRLRGAVPESAREPSDDWQQIFRVASIDLKVNDKQKHLIETAKASNATIGVGVMAAPSAPELEYALTRDEDLQSPQKDLAEIRVALSETTTLTIARTSVEVKPTNCIWHGKVVGTQAPATIMWWPTGKMAGVVQHQGRLYSIRNLGGEMHAVVEMSDERMPREHAPMRSSSGDVRDDPLVNQGEGKTLRPASEASGRKRSEQPEEKRDEFAVAKAREAAANSQRVMASTRPKDIVIDVIVAYTKKATANYDDIKHELIDLAIEESNESFRRSGLEHIKLRLVHAYQTDYVENGAHFEHLWRFADKGDGYMDEIHALRDKYKADVAILIVDDPKGCGLATRVFADAEEAFAVVHHECAASTYSLAHEIGHIIGARHDLSLDKIMTPFAYGHGYVNGTKWRDIMSYKESCGGCPRLPVWSNPKIQINGDVAGTSELDNARVISEQAARVAAFR
jgi:hypothetical protein